MIPTLIIWLCKRYIAPKIKKRNLIQKATGLKMAVILSFFVSSAFPSSARQNYNYIIKRNGTVIGHVLFIQKEEGNSTFLKINSKVNTRAVFKIEVETEDFAHFKEGKLIASDLNRVVNGKTKAAKRTNWIDNGYKNQSGGQISNIQGPINYNMMLLYTKEPTDVSKIYSDNFQCFLNVVKNGAHTYRITFPDGNYNDYHFENGICNLIVVNHSLYTVKIERV